MGLFWSHDGRSLRTPVFDCFGIRQPVNLRSDSVLKKEEGKEEGKDDGKAAV